MPRASPEAGRRANAAPRRSSEREVTIPFVFFAVLFAAACHAAWNAAIKRGLEPLVTTVLISIGAGVVSLAVSAVRRLAGGGGVAMGDRVGDDPSVLFRGLIESYRAGDMGQVYPIARGSAPLMTALVTTLFIGEKLGVLPGPASLRLSRRDVALAARRTRPAKLDRRAVGFALFTAVTICGYSIVDGLGARRAGDPNAYSLVALRRHSAGDGSVTRWRAGAP